MGQLTLDLLREHQDVVYALCYRVLRHRQDAEDAAQEALLKIARQAGDVDDPSRLPAWIHRVALHTATDVARRRRNRAAYESRATPPAPAEDPVAVHQAVADLPDAERWAVVEHEEEVRGIQETLRSMQRARQRLDAGWNGVDGEGASALAIRSRTLRTSMENLCPLEYLDVIRKASGAGISWGGEIPVESDRLLEQARLWPAAERTVAEHLDAFCEALGLGWSLDDGESVLLQSKPGAAKSRLEREARLDEQRRFVALLDRPLSGPRSATLPELAEQLRLATGLPVRLSRGVWESEVVPPGAATVRESLDRLAREAGFRWGLHAGALYVVGAP